MIIDIILVIVAFIICTVGLYFLWKDGNAFVEALNQWGKKDKESQDD